jgi:hypothetical protein
MIDSKMPRCGIPQQALFGASFRHQTRDTATLPGCMSGSLVNARNGVLVPELIKMNMYLCTIILSREHALMNGSFRVRSRRARSVI